MLQSFVFQQPFESGLAQVQVYKRNLGSFGHGGDVEDARSCHASFFSQIFPQRPTDFIILSDLHVLASHTEVLYSFAVLT